MLTIRGSAFIFALVLTFGCGANIATDIGQTRNGGTTDAGTCSGGTLYVPQDYGTIQQAVDVAPQASQDVPCGVQTTIVVATGEYKENILIPARVNVMITGDKGSQVVINGGAYPAITVDSEVSLMLQAVTVSSTPHGTAITANHSTRIDFDSVTILSNYGLWAHSVFSTTITNSTFVGNGNGEGIALMQEEFTPEYEPAHIFNNMFRNLQYGIDSCMGPEPSLGSNGPGDSNQYEQVGEPHAYSAGCQ